MKRAAVNRAECEQQSCLVSVGFENNLSATVSDRGTRKSCYCCGCQIEIQDGTPIPLPDIYPFFQLLDLNQNKHCAYDCSNFYAIFLCSIHQETCLWLVTTAGLCLRTVDLYNQSLPWCPCLILKKEKYCFQISFLLCCKGTLRDESWVTIPRLGAQWALFLQTFTCCFSWEMSPSQ